MSGTTPNRWRTARSPTGIAAHRPLTAPPTAHTHSPASTPHTHTYLPSYMLKFHRVYPERK